MSRYPEQRRGQLRPRTLPANLSAGMFIPPPPLPPWISQSNFVPPPPVPPPSVSQNFPPPPSQANQPRFSPHEFQGQFFSCTNIPEKTVSSEDEKVPLKGVETNIISESQFEIDCWLKRRGLSSNVPDVRSQPKSNIQIHAIRGKLNTVFSLIKDLENGARTLGVMVKTVTEAEWDQKCSEIEIKKKQLTKLLQELNLSEVDLNSLRVKQLKLSKKRERLKRQKAKWKKAKEEVMVLIKNKHVQIDNWLREMQEGIERIQREEELKQEADAVLWGITQKKTQAKRQYALLSALLELRQVRVKRLQAAGKPVLESQITVFNTVIEGLQKMWTKHLEEIGVEEQVLRGMLTQAEVKDDSVRRHKKLVLQEWELAIFGSVGSLDSNMKGKQMEEIRWSWDQFLVPKHTLLSSTIPPGWVLPVTPSSEEWRKLLKY